MRKEQPSRRGFLGAAAASALVDPTQAAAQSAGVKRADLPDLTIKEVKVYVADLSGFRRLNGSETGEIVSLVTAGGIEGNYTIGNRAATSGWLEWAKPALLGKNVVDLLPSITATSGLKATFGFSGGRTGGAGVVAPRSSPGTPVGYGLGNRGGGTWPNYYTAAAEIAMWDLLGRLRHRLCRRNPLPRRLENRSAQCFPNRPHFQHLQAHRRSWRTNTRRLDFER